LRRLLDSLMPVVLYVPPAIGTTFAGLDVAQPARMTARAIGARYLMFIVLILVL